MHIPYCTRKCLYCDFFSIGSRLADWRGLTAGLLRELDLRKDEIATPFTTVYIGGGTPSLMPAEHFSELARGVMRLSKPEEFTIEANPDDVTEHLVDTWLRYGVTRISLGVQSFDDDELKRVGRRHNGEQAESAARLLLGSGWDVSLDLIFGLPGQTLDSLRRSVDKVLTLHPHHISLYSLMFEPGTALTHLRDTGRLDESPEELTEAMFLYITDSLRRAGYHHYEISNFALPGHEARHNTSYWLGLPYLGIGPAAHSYDGLRTRRANPADVKQWMNNFNSTTPKPIYSPETLSDEMLLDEMILTRMRTDRGLNLDEVASRFGETKKRHILENASLYIERGLLKNSANSLILTREGILTSDAIITSLAM